MNQRCDDIHTELVWCGPEPKNNLKNFIDEKTKNVALIREIEHLYVEIEHLVNEINNEYPTTDTSDTDPLNIDTASLKECLNCLAMRRIYPELLEKSDGCECHIEHNERNRNCICQPENFALIR